MYQPTIILFILLMESLFVRTTYTRKSDIPQPQNPPEEFEYPEQYTKPPLSFVR